MKNERQQRDIRQNTKTYIWTAMLLLLVVLIGGMGVKAGVAMQETYGPDRRIERCRRTQEMRAQVTAKKKQEQIS